MRYLLLTSTAFIAATSAHAQSSHDGADEIIIQSSPLQTSEFESFQNVDVLDAPEILDNYEGSLGDTLARLPGVSSSFFGAASGRPIIRGLGGERVRILTNGVGSIDAASASPDHAVTSDGLEAESIEVLRGASALAYGGNAISGVVNIIDGTVPSAIPENGYEGQFYAGYESVNDAWQTAGSVTGAQGPLVVTVQGLHKEAGDYDIPGFAESALLRRLEEAEGEHGEEHEEPSGTAENTGYNFDSRSIGASFVGDRGFIGVAVKDYDSTYGLPGHEHEHEEAGDAEAGHDHGGEQPFIDMDQTRIDLRGEYDLHMPWFDLIRVSAATADYQHTEFEAPGEPATTFMNNGWETRLEVTQAPTDRWSGAFGVQIFDKDFESAGEESFIPKTQTTDIGLFTSQRYDAGKWGGELGARIETRDLDSVNDSRNFDTVSASGGLFMRPADGVFVSGNIAFAQRAPSDSELFADGPHFATGQYQSGNPDLDVEEAWTFEGVTRLDRGRFGFEASLWYAAYDGFIFLAPTGAERDGLPVFAQTQSDADLYGLELSGDAVIHTTKAFELRGDAVLEYVRGEISGGQDLPRIPPFSATLGVETEFFGPRLTTRAEAELVSEQGKVFAFELPTEAYQRVNLSAQWEPFSDKDISLIAQAKNIFDAEARVHSSFLKDMLPLPGRSFRIALRTRF